MLTSEANKEKNKKLGPNSVPLRSRNVAALRKEDHVGLFSSQLKIRGRPPSGYTQLDLTDPEQLVLAILQTIPVK